MNKRANKIPKWPFFLGDGILVLITLLIVLINGIPLTPLTMAFCIFSVGWGAMLTCAPYVLDYQASQKGDSGGQEQWAELRNKLLRLEVRIADMEISSGREPAGGVSHEPFSGFDHEPPLAKEEEINHAPFAEKGVLENNTAAKPMLQKALDMAEDNKSPSVVKKLINGERF